MELNLKRPIVFFDLETTGVNVTNDRIVEITLLRIETNNKECEITYLVNPTIPIPQFATDIHGITNEDVKDKPTFKEIAKNVVSVFEGADMAGFNSNKFDIPLLAEEFLRAEVDFDMRKRQFVDVQVIFHKMEQRNLTAAYKFYCKKDLINAHTSKADTYATYEVLKAQLDHYPDIPKTISELSIFSSQNKTADLAGHIIFNAQNIEVFNFGKYKGMTVEDVFVKDKGYYSWILNSQFPLYTKKVLTEIKLRMNK
ncbi:MAG: DNA polymerase III subunit epsilon [Bacteroidetes bacterium GWA2_32_17]|nr:MAG: DNA polymerase III subunit epsilon [Bacteroidetes bacterium GWA2_32_17]